MSPVIEAAVRSSIGLPGQLVRVVVLMLLYLWRLLCFLLGILRGKPCRPRRPPSTCGDEVPPQVRRKPDPCIYSQSYLKSQGLPVTWNNPDITITEPDGTPVPSGQLLPDHSYLVKARISNAAAYPALGVEVRCDFRDWGLGGPWLPILEPPAVVQEQVVVLHIAHWASSTAVFRWRTPSAAGHFCLRVKIFHPDDKNPANNVGQENTRVIEAAPGDTVSARIMVENPSGVRTQLAVAGDTYRIPPDKWEFDRVTVQRELNGDLVRVDAGTNPVPIPILSARSRIERWAVTSQRPGTKVTRQFYKGQERLFEAQRKALTPLPSGWALQIDGRPIAAGVDLGPGEQREVDLQITVPPDAQPGQEISINLGATDRARNALNGVTAIVRVR